MSQENLEFVRRAYESFNRWATHPDRGNFRDPEIEALLHPEVEFHTSPNAPEAGVYRGREAVTEYHRRVFEVFESVRVELEEVLPAGDRVIIVTRQHTVPRGGQASIVQRVVDVWTIREGLLAERHAFSSRQDALEAVAPRE
jgi:ketosteroid isomerase-like protein